MGKLKESERISLDRKHLDLFKDSTILFYFQFYALKTSVHNIEICAF